MITELDQRLFDRAARGETPVLDRILPPLTHSADHGLLWLGLAGLLAVTGHRRAAVRGLTSMAVASATANVPAKLSIRRPRPDLGGVPLPRRLVHQPTTTSFPSGHSASAAAFAAGVALESPWVGLPVATLACGVAYGRVHTGVHYPGDVVAGIALGVGAAVAVRRVWPVRPDRPAVVTRTRVDAPALPDGDGLVVMINEAAGSGGRADEVQAELEALLPAVRVVRCRPDGDVLASLEEAAAGATVLGVVGGDGTVNAAAGVALEHGLPLAVIPGGTLDHFAAELGVTGVPDAVEAVQQGSAVEVSLGSASADGDVFLNTFALGVYPELVHEREKHEARWGKWPALVLALVKVLPGATSLAITVDGEPHQVWTLFAGNGQYHPSGFAPSWRARLDEGRVDVRIVDASQPFGRLRLVTAVLTGRLGRCRVYSERVADRVEVHSDVPLRIARDGEVGDGPQDLVLQAREQRLLVYRPGS